ncbi:FAD-binding protein [Deltaproteobacteria bacterium]|nr:FAD-binding protein [Deltaproteobacteria bacterium]
MQEEKIGCDVLCIGGGIAGLMAAIRASDMGAKVVLAEKSNTLRSGSGGMGNDHFQCYIPDVHGDFDLFWKELFYGQIVGFLRTLDAEYIRFWFENSFDVVKLWDSWGIPMKYEGRYEFAGHGFPGKQLNHLKYSGMNQKPILTKEAKKRGVNIVNRVMGVDIIKDKNDRVIGALGLSTREDKVYVFEAGSVILCTGSCNRVYPSVTPGADNNRAFPLTNSGDGRAMAYRAGAELKDLELVHRHAGPKYFSRCGQATWVGVLRDRKGNPVGPWASKPDKTYGDMATEVSKTIFEEYKKSGKGPVYMDMNGISKEDLDYMVHWMKNEGNETIIKHIEEEGLDLDKSAVEFQTFEMQVDGGVRANYKGETAVKGLYASGDDVSATISHAAVFGWSAGENAAKYASSEKVEDIETARADIEAKKLFFNEIKTRGEGAEWQEALSALQQIMFDYCGDVRSDVLLETGSEIIGRLKNKARSSLKAGNPHELINCIQVINQIDIGELVLISAYDRRETRALHFRPEYTFSDPLLGNKVHLIKQLDGDPVMEWIDIKQ